MRADFVETKVEEVDREAHLSTAVSRFRSRSRSEIVDAVCGHDGADHHQRDEPDRARISEQPASPLREPLGGAFRLDHGDQNWRDDRRNRQGFALARESPVRALLFYNTLRNAPEP